MMGQCLVVGVCNDHNIWLTQLSRVNFNPTIKQLEINDMDTNQWLQQIDFSVVMSQEQINDVAFAFNY